MTSFDPEKLKVLANKNKEANKNFFQKLKKRIPANFDQIMQELHEEAFSEIDCLQCANCCRTLGPRITNKDIERLSKFLRIKPSQFCDKYLVVDEDNDYIFKSMPCPFLMSDNYCSVYAERPKACREYPHTDRKNFHQLFDVTLKNTQTCPAVYRIVEKLKSLKS
jgi:uncharacterized protein